MTIRTALLQGAKALEDASVDAARLTAELLLLHAMPGHDRAWLYAHSGDELAERTRIVYGRYLHERISGKPLQYITGQQEFYGRLFEVTPDVLIPRPETEFVVEAALARISPGARILDIGTGSGAIAVTLALEAPHARIFAVDLSAPALRVARHNAARLQASVAFMQADLLDTVAGHCLQMIVSNPPYIAETSRETLQREVRDHEPHLALFSGDDGLGHYRRIVTEAARVLVPNGWLILELGFDSAPHVQSMLDPGLWRDISLIDDLAGYPRVIAAARL